MDATVIPATYALAVIDGGDSSHTSAEDGATEIISAMDGLVISGGPDIDPSMYGADLDPDTLDTYPKQDMREIALIKAEDQGGSPAIGHMQGYANNVCCRRWFHASASPKDPGVRVAWFMEWCIFRS